MASDKINGEDIERMADQNITNQDEKSAKTIRILDKNGVEKDVDSIICNYSITIKNLLGDLEIDTSCPNNERIIPVPNVTHEIIQIIVNHLKAYQEKGFSFVPVEKEDKQVEEKVDKFNKEFFDIVQGTSEDEPVNGIIFETTLAANFLDCKSVLNAICKYIAGLMKGKSPEEIRKKFEIKNDFTPEEEEQIRKENEWCEEK